MKTFLDDQPVEVDRPTLAAAISAGVARAEGSGRIVVEIHADGRRLGDDELDPPSDEEAGLGEVRLVSAEPRSLVRVTLFDAADALEQIAGDHVEAARLIHQGELPAALERLGFIVQVWQAVRDAVEKGPALLGVGLDSLDLGDADLPGSATDLAADLERLKSGLARQDWSEVGDLLEFDLVEQASRWRGLLRALADGLAAAGTGDAAR